MTDDQGSAPTIPDTQAPTHGPPSVGGASPKTPDSRYALRRLLGQGGMGEVWLAHDTRVDREIAIKLMRGGAGEPNMVARFLREAHVQGRLEHPNVVPVHDLGAAADAPYFAMKRVTGTTLGDVLAAADVTKWPRRTLLARFVDVCLAVEFAHQRGVVHRDLKPANIMLGDFGEAYVLDWGLARVIGDSDLVESVARATSGGSGSAETEVGALLGTPGYMSPEQVRGEAIDARTDVYALGCILFEILTGTHANPRARALENTLAADEHRPSARGAIDVPPELDEACAKATSHEHATRTSSARGVADMVQRYLDGDRDMARRRELAAEHVARAQVLATTGDDGRVEALREAGSAIALDVENTAAQQLLARLLLEPPERMPDGAKRTVEAAKRITEIEGLRWGAVSYSMFLIGLPLVWLLGVSNVWPLVLIGAEVSTAIFLCLIYTRGPAIVSIAGAAMILIVHCAIIATVGLLLGPLLLVPILIFGSATIMFTASAVRVPKTIVCAHLLALVVPLTLELLGVLPRTFSLDGGGLTLRPWAVDLSPSALMMCVLGSVVLQLIGNMLVLDRQRQSNERAADLIHVQAWQLKQLVPRSGSPS